MNLYQKVKSYCYSHNFYPFDKDNYFSFTKTILKLSIKIFNLSKLLENVNNVHR